MGAIVDVGVGGINRDCIVNRWCDLSVDRHGWLVGTDLAR